MSTSYTHISAAFEFLSKAEEDWLVDVLKTIAVTVTDDETWLAETPHIAIMKHLVDEDGWMNWGVVHHIHEEDGVRTISFDDDGDGCPHIDNFGFVLQEFLALYRPDGMLTAQWSEGNSRGTHIGGGCLYVTAKEINAFSLDDVEEAALKLHKEGKPLYKLGLYEGEKGEAERGDGRFCVSFWIDGKEQLAYCDTREQAINCAEIIKETTAAYQVEIHEKGEPHA